MRKLAKYLYVMALRAVPILRPIYLSRSTQTPIPLLQLLAYKIGLRRIYWPTHPSSVVVDSHRIHIGIETSPGLMPGCYVQGTNGILIGDYTQIAANVAIISANHELTDNRRHKPCRPVYIGSHCWIGTHAVILPGVRLGNYTVVAAGAIVTKSYEQGYQILAGNPAKPIKILDPAQCALHRSPHEFHGFIAATDFASFRNRNLEALQ